MLDSIKSDQIAPPRTTVVAPPDDSDAFNAGDLLVIRYAYPDFGDNGDVQSIADSPDDLALLP